MQQRIYDNALWSAVVNVYQNQDPIGTLEYFTGGYVFFQ